MSKVRAPTKDVRELIRKVAASGCEVSHLGSGHYRISRPGDFPTVTISGTSVSPHTFKRQKSLIRKLLGVEV